MLPLIAVESPHTLPTNRVVLRHAKIMHVTDGALEVETTDGLLLLTPGASLTVGAGRWRLIRPRPHARVWTVYADESFLRTQMGLLLPDRTRVPRGVHPKDWDGTPILLTPGISGLQLLVPLWRQMSILRANSDIPEVATARAVELFARWVGIVAPTFVAEEFADGACPLAGPTLSPIQGRLTDAAALGHVGRAVRLLRERMHEPWTVTALSECVALSRAHLTRLFTIHTGISPIRFLTEVRLTEFTRLVEETELSVAHAALTVGWRDARIASAWFSRRFGITPTQYRLNPHPHHTDPDSCDACDARQAAAALVALETCRLVEESQSLERTLTSVRAHPTDQ